MSGARLSPVPLCFEEGVANVVPMERRWQSSAVECLGMHASRVTDRPSVQGLPQRRPSVRRLLPCRAPLYVYASASGHGILGLPCPSCPDCLCVQASASGRDILGSSACFPTLGFAFPPSPSSPPWPPDRLSWSPLFPLGNYSSGRHGISREREKHRVPLSSRELGML